MITPMDASSTLLSSPGPDGARRGQEYHGAPSARGGSSEPAVPMMRIPGPSPIAGMDSLNGRSFRRLAWLSLRNAPANRVIMAVTGAMVVSLALASWFIAGMQGAAHPLAVAAVATPVGLGVFVVLLLFLQELVIRSWKRNGGWVVGYFTANSCQLVHPDDDAWVLTDHLTAHRGHGEAGPFRRQVFAHLASEADRFGVTITLDTRVRRLADLYVQEMPGLEVTGVRRQRFATVYMLQRTPRQDPRRHQPSDRSGEGTSPL